MSAIRHRTKSPVSGSRTGTDPANESILFMDSRRFCHRCIAQLPAPAREIYHGRVDQLAGRWYKEGAARRDVALLRRVVDQAFCSSWAGAVPASWPGWWRSCCSVSARRSS